MTCTEPHTARARLLTQIEEAARVIAPLWPLSTFIAVNPLWDLRQLPFQDAIATARQVLPLSGHPSPSLFADAYRRRRLTEADLRAAVANHTATVPGSGPHHLLTGCGTTRPTAAERYDLVSGTAIAPTVDREVAKWCAAYLGASMPAAPTAGLYAAWQTIVSSDPAARKLVGKAGRARLARLPTQPEQAILTSLERIGVPEDDRTCELAGQLARMPGWAGHAKWRSRWAAPDHPGPVLNLVDYLAVRLGYESELLSTATAGRAPTPEHPHRVPRRSGAGKPPGAAEPPGFDGLAGIESLPDDLRESLAPLRSTEAAAIWLDAYEGHYRDWLLDALDRPRAPKPRVPPGRQRVQAVFCIDVRSEGLRRHLEAVGPYETFGFAGFFALPIRYQPYGSAETVDLCPVLLRPNATMTEHPATEPSQPTHRQLADRQLAGRQALTAAQAMFDTARKTPVSSFILAEASGFLAGPVAAAKTLAPIRYSKLRDRLRRTIAPPAITSVDAEPPYCTMSDEEQALFAETALTTMGLTDDFAPVVLLCGHGSTTENNPFASSLDCGACGGNRGGASARAAAAILNRAATRQLLATRGIDIPGTTVFVAGEHDTTTDTVAIFDTEGIPGTHQASVASLQADLRRACGALAAQRAVLLPGSPGVAGRRRHLPVRLAAARSADWAQVQPEWGLARNAAFIVGPRSLTAGVDLQCRCFLHSYRPDVDPEGVALETILTAPMVVAHWINAQYYFSTVDPDVLSAGDKTVHNVVAGIGVVAGAGGDLQVGLPLQSLFDGDRAYHEPMRLLTVVQAPQDRLDAVIARNPVLRDLFDGRWVHLVARNDSDDCWKIRRPGGSWECWTPAETRTEEMTTNG